MAKCFDCYCDIHPDHEPRIASGQVFHPTASHCVSSLLAEIASLKREGSRDHQVRRLTLTLQERDAEVRALRGFAQELVSDEWCLNTEGLQEVMEKHGLLKETQVTEPCGPDCYCETEYGEDIFPTNCYKTTPLLTGEPGPGREG